jgi:allophanate hydrolase
VERPAANPPFAAPEDGLLTVSDWQAAVRDGRDVLALARARALRIAARDHDPVWISRITPAVLESRLDALQRLARSVPDTATLLARHPLFGVPFAVKDNIDAGGWPTTAACRAGITSPTRSATAVQRLLDAGAVLMGKTNLDQFATGLVGTRSPYGIPESTWAPGRVSGGSSSGSAVAVARGDVVFALGTDTAGSGRIPAGFNHLVGVKPTPGRVSTSGVLPACRTLDCVSVFALDVDDGARVLSVLEGDDPTDPYSRFEPGPLALVPRSGTRLRVGVPREPLLDAALGYPAAWQAAVARLEALGCEAVPVDMAPLNAVAALLYDGPWVAERLAAVEPWLQHTPEALDPTVRRIIERGQGLSAVDTFRAQYELAARRRDAAALWQSVDLLMVPTAPGHPSLDELRADPVGANARLGTYTNFVNLLGWCACALPSGVTPAGLPFGVTFIAEGGADAAVLRFARGWQALAAQPMGALGVTVRTPPASPGGPAVEPQMPLVVVGAHLSGMPLNGQLTERGAVRLAVTRTAPHYRLYALARTQPPKPGLLRVAEGGGAIDVEVWSVPQRHVGSFLALVPPPLGLGSVELADGTWATGFLCEPWALDGAQDITPHGGWRAWLAHRTPASPSPV